MRTKTLLIIIALLVLQASSSLAQSVYDRQSGLLSARYQGVPLRQVLSEIGRKTGITFHIDPTVDKVVYIDEKRRPVDEVLNEIIAPLNCMLLYRGDEVTAVKIYEKTPADAMQEIAPAGRAATQGQKVEQGGRQAAAPAPADDEQRPLRGTGQRQRIGR